MAPTKWIGTVLTSLLLSLFLGVVVVSMGLGAMFPSIDQVAGPFVCGGGSLQEHNKNYHPQPGMKVTTVNWSCADATEADQHAVDGWAVTLVAGTIYGLIIFIPTLLLLVIRQRRKT
jgi:hypothetical protein